MKYLKNLPINDLKDKNVVVRVDFNVPISQNGEIKDDSRIKASLKTIKFLLQSNAKEIILISHLGRPVVRPKEKIENIVRGNQKLVLEPAAEKLSEWLKIKTAPERFILKKINYPAYRISPKIIMLENIRFDWREEKNNDVFSKELATLGDIFVNDAFAVCHRTHSSVVGITKFLPSYAGYLIEKEMINLDKLLIEPEKPFVLVLGGAKVYDKMMVIKNILKKVDFILLGGVMLNTFMATRGIDIKRSIVEKDRLELADKLFRKAPKKFIFPTSLVWDKGKIVDVDPKAVETWKRYFDKAKTIFWNGTMGLTSMGINKYTFGTQKVAKIIAGSEAVKVVSGGDTISEVAKLKLESKFDFVSTGGGATLEYMAGNKLPGLEVLK
jgi:phosphoglycerate kinase